MRQISLKIAGLPGYYALVAAIFLAGIGLAVAPAGEKIIFSSPSSPASVSTNSGSGSARKLNSNSGMFNRSTSDVFRPLGKSLDPTEALQDEMSGEIRIPRMNNEKERPLTKKEKEAADKKKNWAFTTMKDLETDAKGRAGETTNVDDLVNGDGDKSTSVIERFINGGDNAVTNHTQAVQWSRGSFLDRDDSRGNDSALRRSPGLGESLRQDFLGSDFKPDNASRFSGGYSGLNQAGGENLSSMKHLNEFRKMIDPDTVPIQQLSGTPGSGLFGSSGGGPSSISSQYGSSGQSFSTFSHYSIGAPSGGLAPGAAFSPGGQNNSYGTAFSTPLGRPVSTQPSVQQMLNPFESVSKHNGF